jgi:glycosyltransferase involved in cell wall biosynthesis
MGPSEATGDAARGALSVVIPAFDEVASIRAGNLARVVDWCASQDPPAEIVVVDDGSSDGTGDLAAGFPVRVLRIPHGGKAAALMAGIREVRTQWVLCADMDLATPIEEAPSLVEALTAGADLVIGTRGFCRPGAPPSRLLMSMGHWALRRSLLGLRWKDTQCGFKAFGREAGLEILSHLQVYGPRRVLSKRGPGVDSGFDVEFLLVARRLGMEIREVPVSWSHRSTPRVGKLRDSWLGALDLLAIASASRRGLYPKSAMGSCG